MCPKVAGRRCVGLPMLVDLRGLRDFVGVVGRPKGLGTGIKKPAWLPCWFFGWAAGLRQRVCSALAYLTCLPIRPAISNIETCGLPNTFLSLSSALIMRLFAASCRLLALM